MSDVQNIKLGSKEFVAFKRITGATDILVDEKFESKRPRVITCNFIATSNDKMNHALDTNDRRWMIVKPSGKKLVGTELAMLGQLTKSKFDAPMEDELRYEALSAIKRYLLVSKWQELGMINTAPSSATKRDLAYNSRPVWERNVIDAVVTSTGVFMQRVITADLVQIFLQMDGYKGRPIHKNEPIEMLEGAGIIKPLTYVDTNGNKRSTLKTRILGYRASGDNFQPTIEFQSGAPRRTKIYVNVDLDVGDLVNCGEGDITPLVRIRKEYSRAVGATLYTTNNDDDGGDDDNDDPERKTTSKVVPIKE